MRRWETYASLAAVVLASLSTIDLGGRPRPVLAFAAVGILVLVCYARLRARIFRKTGRELPDAYERALRIQEERDRRYLR